MKRILLVAIAGALLLSSLGTDDALAAVKEKSQLKGPVQIASRPASQAKVHNVGTLWNAITNSGVYGDPNNLNPTGEWPGGAEIYYIWEGRFWLGARIGGTPFVSHADYGNYELYPTDGSTFYFGSGPKSIQDAWVRYDDLDGSISGHTPIGVMMSERALAWSLPDYDDFEIYLMEVKNASGGTLNNVFVTWVYDNDVGTGPGGPAHGNGGAQEDLVDYDGWAPAGQNRWQDDWVDPLDIDGDGVTGYDYWGWPIADPKNPYWDGYTDEYAPDAATPEPDGIYDEFQIYQFEGGPVITYQVDVPSMGFVAGQPVITSEGDTLKGYLLSRNMSYMMDGDDLATPAQDFGERDLSPACAGAIGTRLLYIPMQPFNTTEADSIPRPYSHQWWNWESDPASDDAKYQYMEGTHELSAGMNFMPHPWDYGAGAPTFDYRYLQSIGPINGWGPDETKKFVMCTAVGWGLQGLRENIDNAMVAYYSGDRELIGDPVLTFRQPEAYGDQLGFSGASASDIVDDLHFILPIPPAIPNLNYSGDDQSVNLVWDTSAETAIDSFVGGADFEGYKVYRSKYTTADWELIAAFDVRDEDVWLVNTDGDTVNPILVGSETLTLYDEGYADAKEGVQGTDWSYIMVNLPGTSLADIPHQFTDAGGQFLGESDPGEDEVLIFNNVEPPINGLDYYYAVVAYDPDKATVNSIESSRSNYRTVAASGAPDPVVPRAAAAAVNDLSGIKVVPNPYKGTAEFEERYFSRITFINLPPRCKISIFSLTGDLIDEITKNDAQSGTASWDLNSRNNQQIKSGLYLYVVETPEGDKMIDKFLVIR